MSNQNYVRTPAPAVAGFVYAVVTAHQTSRAFPDPEAAAAWAGQVYSAPDTKTFYAVVGFDAHDRVARDEVVARARALVRTANDLARLGLAPDVVGRTVADAAQHGGLGRSSN